MDLLLLVRATGEQTVAGVELDQGSAGRGRPGRGDVRFAVRLTPRGGADRVDGVSDEGALQARVAAPAVAGAANAALIRLIAGELDVSRGAVRIVAGANGRQKLVVVDGIARDAVARRWPGIRV